jgi:hypothetical protein
MIISKGSRRPSWIVYVVCKFTEKSTGSSGNTVVTMQQPGQVNVSAEVRVDVLMCSAESKSEGGRDRKDLKSTFDGSMNRTQATRPALLTNARYSSAVDREGRDKRREAISGASRHDGQ